MTLSISAWNAIETETPHNNIFVVKLIVVQLIQKFLIIHESRRFITIIIRPRHWTTSISSCSICLKIRFNVTFQAMVTFTAVLILNFVVKSNIGNETSII
jgi:hypothetical protein